MQDERQAPRCWSKPRFPFSCQPAVPPRQEATVQHSTHFRCKELLRTPPPFSLANVLSYRVVIREVSPSGGYPYGECSYFQRMAESHCNRCHYRGGCRYPRGHYWVDAQEPNPQSQHALSNRLPVRECFWRISPKSNPTAGWRQAATSKAIQSLSPVPFESQPLVRSRRAISPCAFEYYSCKYPGA